MNAPTASRFNRYLTVILRWLAITAVVFVLTLLSGFYITENLLHKVYTATAQIQIQPRRGQGQRQQTMDPTSFQAEFVIMQSPDFLLPIIYDLGLDKAWAKRIDKSGLDDLPPQDALLPSDALAYMHKILKLDFARGTNIINITVSSDVPKEAADIANAIADRYKTMRDVEEGQRTHRGSDFLHDAIVQEQKIFDEKKAQVEKLRNELEREGPITIPGALTTPPSQEQTALLQRFRDAQRQLDHEQDVLDDINARLKENVADLQHPESPVRIISRAEPPAYPSKPNKSFVFIVTVVVAGFLSLAAASFVEIIFLFSRASERTDN